MSGGKESGLGLSTIGPVRMDPQFSDRELPILFQAAVPGVNLAAWASENQQVIESALHRHGAILFRGFDLHSIPDFETAAASIAKELYGGYGDLPRAGASEKIYTSTPYPADQPILFHNESSHLNRWPLRIAFFCVQAAQQGGETPIMDCREVCRQMNPTLLERFRSRGLMYIRNFDEGLDVSWQKFFHTDDRQEVERKCREERLEWDWKPSGGLRIRHRTEAVRRHPRTGEEVFFNQVQLHHLSGLDPEVRRSLLSIFPPEDLPRNVCYGDGSPIQDSVMEELGDLYQDLSVAFPWREGDLVMLDNMLVAHARNPFVGPRRIVVAMGEMVESEPRL